MNTSTTAFHNGFAGSAGYIPRWPVKRFFFGNIRRSHRPISVGRRFRCAVNRPLWFGILRHLDFGFVNLRVSSTYFTGWLSLCDMVSRSTRAARGGEAEPKVCAA